MDLSQQELPLTAYFTRGSKKAGFRAVPYNKDKPTEDSQSVARSSKRRKSNAGCFTTSPSDSSAGQSKSRMKTLQLPTPATSSRKRTRNGRLELPPETPLTSTSASFSPVERNAVLLSEEDLVQLESGPTHSKLLQSSRRGAEDAIPELFSTPLATPSTDWRGTTKSIGIEFRPGLQYFDNGETGIATPRTLPRRIPEPVHGIDNHPPLARSNPRLPSESSQASIRLPDSKASDAVLPLQHSDRSTAGLPCFPVDLDCADPFYARKKSGVFAQRDGAFAQTPKQSSIQSKTLDSQPSDGRAIPMLPVPSSQSQYLLHLDATPKRKRCSQRIERVISSQTQEERELTLSTPHRPTTMVNLPVGVSPGKYMRGNAQIPRLGCSERKTQHVYTLGSTPVVSPNSSPTGPSRSFLTTKEALDELLSKSSSLSRRERLTPYHSPSCKAKTPRRSRRNSTENILPAHIEDSLTESESESDILQMMMKYKLSTLGLPSRGMNQVPRYSSVARDASPPVGRGSAESNLPVADDDSATEAESDTEILHCVAEIGKKRPRDHRSEVSREDTPRPPIISPLVSPTRPRVAPMPSIIGSTQFLIEEGAGPSLPGPRASYPSMKRPRIPSESLPSVVRDFMRMFPGDESYPADFPESLRV